MWRGSGSHSLLPSLNDRQGERTQRMWLGVLSIICQRRLRHVAASPFKPVMMHGMTLPLDDSGGNIGSHTPTPKRAGTAVDRLLAAPVERNDASGNWTVS